jgi:hypothetical protein
MFIKALSVLTLGLALTACAPVYGQYGNRSGNGSSARADRRVFDDAYQAGYRQGRADARDGDRFDPRGQRQYRNADNGRYGNRDDYRRAYRQGFEQGYAEGYRDNARGNNRRRR